MLPLLGLLVFLWSLTNAPKLTFFFGVKSVGVTAAAAIYELLASSFLRVVKPLWHKGSARALDHWQSTDVTSCKINNNK